ncbi:MAG: DUF5060 domain-containing protein, partial [Acidobacteriota bacterium]
MFRPSPPAAVVFSCALTVAFAISPARAADVTSFTLIDAGADQPVAAHDPLVDGAVLDLSTLPTELSVRANVSGAVGSVEFDLSGAQSHSQTESVAPYSLFGDTDGDYDPWTPAPGAYGLVARSFTGSSGGGTAGVDYAISFTVEAAGAPPDGDGSVTVYGGDPGDGEPIRRWHRATLALAGPGATETSSPNPFLDYRFQVLFTGPSGQVIDAPGYFAADGAGDALGDGSGHTWRAHLAPDEGGEWSYAISFRAGAEVAVDTTGADGAPLAPYDGVAGVFQVLESDKAGVDFRAPDRGLIKNRGGHYLSEADGDPWVKGGPNIPENLLGYVGFD